MVIQAIIIGGIYIYSKLEKWNLESEMTVFLYPFFAITVIFLLIISGLISFGYFINKLLRVHKFYFIIPLLIIITSFLVSNELFNEMKLRENNIERFQEKREEIVELILQEKLTPDKNGIVTLPEELRDEEMARGGCVSIVKCGTKEGIYFCTFSGLMENSAGFVYLTEDIFDVDIDTNIKLQSENFNNWYFCGTG